MNSKNTPRSVANNVRSLDTGKFTKAKTRRNPVKKPSMAARTRLTLTVATLTPAMGATFGHYAAELALQGSWLAAVPTAIALAVLTVSLPHVAQGLREVTGQSTLNCYLLAAGIDAGLVTAKAGLMLGTLSAGWLLWTTLAVLLIMSAALNAVAYSVREPDTK